MKHKAIIFDFDGVIFDSEKIHLSTCNQVFKTVGFAVEEEKYFQSYVGISDNEMFDLILNDAHVSLKPDEVMTLRQNKIAAFKDYVANSTPLEGVTGVREFIQIYAKTLNNFAICSGSTSEEIEATLARLENGELRRHFKYITSINDVSAGKPSPEGYLLTANRLAVSPQDCLVIEDSPVGIAAAKSAGMTVIGITTTHDKSAIKQADFIASSYKEIDSWIKS